VSDTSTVVPDVGYDDDDDEVSSSPLMDPMVSGAVADRLSQASTVVPEVGSELDEAGMCLGLLDVPSSSPDTSQLDVYYYPQQSSSELDWPGWVTTSTLLPPLPTPPPVGARGARRHLIFYDDDDQAVPTGEPEE